MTRTVFFVSDGTGITAETLGRSLLSQFEMIPFDFITVPYVNNRSKAEETLARIEQACTKDGQRCIIFTTLINPEISHFLRQGSALIIDFFQTFINPLENEFGHQSSHTVGRSHGVKNYTDYMGRINAVNFALAYDDGVNTSDYANADVVLLGVSRCGKTPTCLYLALQFGIYAANYPLTKDNMAVSHLPSFLVNHHRKLFGLTIDPLRLQKIRQERLPDKDYSSRKACEFEVNYTEALFRRERISYLDTTSRSIEEIAAEIMTIAKIKRRLY